MSIIRMVTAQTGFERALAAEHRLEPIVRMVDALCALAGPGHAMCAGCAWTGIVKPLVLPLVGWGRGYHDDEAKDHAPDESRWRAVNLAELLAEEDRRPRTPCTTATERWLRSAEAYDAFTDVLLSRLNAADPANGCGIGRMGS